MKEIKKVIFLVIFFLLFTLIFYLLEFGAIFEHPTMIIKPSIFSFFATISILKPNLRRISFAISFSLLFLMAMIYLFGQISISNWVGSLGFGILVIVIVSYLGDFVRKGFID